MPKSIIDSIDKYQTIIRPSIIQVCNDIKIKSSIPEDTKLFYLGYAEQRTNTDTTMGGESHREIDFAHKNHLIVESNITYQDISYFSGQPYLSKYSPIFHDSIHKIRLSPIYNIMNVELSIRYIAEDRPTAYSWETEMRRRIGQSMMGNLHRLEYTFPVPQTHIDTLSYLHSLIRPTKEPKMAFTEWLDDIARERITVVVNQSGCNPMYAVNQVQLGVMGTWNIDATPNINKMDSGDLYAVQFGYSFHFDVMGTTILEYPLMIDNSVVDEEYRRSCDFYDPMVMGNPGLFIGATDKLRPLTNPKYPNEMALIPCFDEWRVKRAPARTSTLFTAMIIVDEDNPAYVMNLNNLGDEYILADWVVNLLEIFHDKLNYPGHAPLLAQIYRNDHWLMESLYEVDCDLNITTNSPMTIANCYHVRLAVYTDLTLLSEHAIAKLLENGKLTLELLNFLSNEDPELPELSPDGTLSRLEFFNFITTLKETHPMYKNGIDVKWLRVNTCVIATEKVEENANI